MTKGTCKTKGAKGNQETTETMTNHVTKNDIGMKRTKSTKKTQEINKLGDTQGTKETKGTSSQKTNRSSMLTSNLGSKKD